MAHNAYPTNADLEAFLLEAGLDTLLAAVGSSISDLDLVSAIDTGIETFERETGRVMLALADSIRHFDAPVGPRGMIDLKRDLAAVTTVTFQGVTQVQGTDYRLLPIDRDLDNRPWDRVQFLVIWPRPSYWALNSSVAITGRWGYSATAIPGDAWNAMLAAAALSRLPMFTTLRFKGFVRWQEADMMEDYGAKPFQYLLDEWQALLDQALMRYRRVTVGL